MSMDGERVRIVENPAGWFGPTLVGKTAIAEYAGNASEPGHFFYHLRDDDVLEHLLFAECRLEVVE